jgi:hypothetical protein
MTSATPGWYPDRTDPSLLRWWNGTVWTAATMQNPRFANARAGATRPVISAAATTKTRGRVASPRTTPSTSGWVGPVAAAVGIFVVSIIAAASSGFGGFLLVWGLALLAGGIYAFVTKRPGLFRIPSKRAAAIVLTSGVLVALIGTGTSALTPRTAPIALSSSSAPTETATTTPTPTPAPVVKTSEARETAAIPFERITVQDAGRDVGTSTITTPGADGELTTIYTVTTIDGVETSREQIGQEVTRAPVTEVTTQGTRQPAPVPAPAPPAQQAPPVAAPAPGCDSNYAGACVPVASDVDCAGGSGNGPEYVRGPVRIVGSDIYDLDRDGDGIACD